MTLSIHGKERTSVFQLTRDDENSATFALGWVLEKSTQYRQLFLKEIFNEALDAEDTLIELQKHSSGGGFTDIELSGPGFHAILEAKRWWEVSTVEQLEQYAARLASGDAMQKRLISISAADRSYAQRRLPRALQDVEIAHLSWGDLRRLAAKAHALATGFQEKLWLREMMQHLKEFVFVDRQIDNNVFGASLGHEPMVTGKSHTGIDFVEKDRRYFHPIGKHWPPRPPNYMGFRYRGRLQSVHHVDGFEIVERLSTYNSLWGDSPGDHFVYTLGPPMRPAREMKTGNLYMTLRVTCAIDTLLSGAFDTIREARDETKRRLSAF
jgi:hypothetical protein